MPKEFIRKTKENKPVIAICYDFDKESGLYVYYDSESAR